MKRKGFTLVELLGILAVISIMLLIIVPAVMRTMKNADNQKYVAFQNIVKQAAEFYIETNRDLYPELNNKLGYTTINVGNVIDSGYLKSNLINPSTGEVIDRSEEIGVLTTENGVIDYEYPLDAGYSRKDLLIYYDSINNKDDAWHNYGSYEQDANLIMFDKNSDSGFNGNYLTFDGVNDYIETNYAPNELLGQTFTISTRVYTTDVSTYRGIYGLHSGELGIVGIVGQFEGGVFDAAFGDGTSWRSNFISDSLFLNNWVTLTVVYAGQKYTKIYINGNLTSLLEVDSPIVMHSNLNVGRSMISNDRYFKGNMCNFLLFERELSESEIKGLYEMDKMRCN